ncbi:hypothetical protein N8639_01165 [bacterium]|nr:hypothetical protein [bacterium]
MAILGTPPLHSLEKDEDIMNPNVDYRVTTFVLLVSLVIFPGCGGEKKSETKNSAGNKNSQLEKTAAKEETEPDPQNIDSYSVDELQTMINSQPDETVKKYGHKFVQVEGQVHNFLQHGAYINGKGFDVVLESVETDHLRCLMNQKKDIQAVYPGLKVTLAGKIKVDDLDSINFTDCRLIKSEGNARAFSAAELYDRFEQDSSAIQGKYVIVTGKIEKSDSSGTFEMDAGNGKTFPADLFLDKKEVSVGQTVTMIGLVKRLGVLQLDAELVRK